MTKDFFQSVEQFNTAAGVMPAEGRTFDPRLVAFYTGMQCEELAEKLRAIDVEGDNAFIRELDELGSAMKQGYLDELFAKADRKDLLDADIDLQVVSEGAILASGADGTGARDEVCRSNDAKIVDGKVLRDPVSGKVIKPEGWTPPDLAPFVCKSQGAQP